ncbi:MAG: hypothetical protein IPO26_16325 [Saprospiraceae bacterium]|nr:hypothetical protein [Saprospiraceae bacterium]
MTWKNHRPLSRSDHKKRKNIVRWRDLYHQPRMALSLSDMASKNVRLDSLFRDEGFGTFDPETMEFCIDHTENYNPKAIE